MDLQHGQQFVKNITIKASTGGLLPPPYWGCKATPKPLRSRQTINMQVRGTGKLRVKKLLVAVASCELHLRVAIAAINWKPVSD